METYDLIVIGSGPAGEKAAVKAAYFKYRVALVEKEDVYGGAGVNTGTLPSKTLKETSLYLSGRFDRGLYGVDRPLAKATIENFMFHKNEIIESESQEVYKNFLRHHVTLYHGVGSFCDKNKVCVKNGKESITIEGKNILIATGSHPFHPPEMDFDDECVLDSDTILNINHVPDSIAVLGAGVIGCEYATIFSTMGTKVYLINRNDKILSFIDKQVANSLLSQMKQDRIEFFFNDSVKKIEKNLPTEKEKLTITLASNKILKIDMFLYAAGRNGNISSLNLGILQDIHPTNRDTIPVDPKTYETKVHNIYAVGDVIGFPALASTSMDQGRVAVAYMFDKTDIEKIAQVVPYGIYTIPEISTAGLTQEEAISRGIPHEIGIAKHKDMPRGKIMGAKNGFLKLVFLSDTKVIIGVHIIGHLATELIHHGVDLIEGKKTLLDVIGNVYNYPTLHDLYKYAAYDGLGNLAGYKIKKEEGLTPFKPIL